MAAEETRLPGPRLQLYFILNSQSRQVAFWPILLSQVFKRNVFRVEGAPRSGSLTHIPFQTRSLRRASRGGLPRQRSSPEARSPFPDSVCVPSWVSSEVSYFYP